MQRVVITGVGVVSAIGHDVPAFAASLREGRSGLSPLGGNLRFPNGAQVTSFDPGAHFDSRRLAFLDRFSQFALVAAREAARDARIDWPAVPKHNAAVITGSGIGGQGSQEDGFTALYLDAKPSVHPFTIARTMTSAASSHISMEFGITGPCFNFSTACASAAHAIGHALWMVRSGAVGLAIAGGSEAPFHFGLLKAWEAMRVVSPDLCRPFSVDRNGMILGEGAAMLVLESLDSALARNAPIHAEITGFGMSADAGHITLPSHEGAAAAMRAALHDARLSPDAIGYINAHGTATKANDASESEAIRLVFGDRAAAIPVSSTKSMHGHALGAAGALEAIATVLALRDGFLPPTIHFTAPDPECPLDIVANHARDIQTEHALSNSFAFGGLNAVLAFRQWQNQPNS